MRSSVDTSKRLAAVLGVDVSKQANGIAKARSEHVQRSCRSMCARQSMYMSSSTTMWFRHNTSLGEVWTLHSEHGQYCEGLGSEESRFIYFLHPTSKCRVAPAKLGAWHRNACSLASLSHK